MDRFWTMCEKSVVVSGLVALGLAGAVCYLAVTGQEIPDGLGIPFGAVIGYFFGAKQQAETNRAVQAARAREGR